MSHLEPDIIHAIMDALVEAGWDRNGIWEHDARHAMTDYLFSEDSPEDKRKRALDAIGVSEQNLIDDLSVQKSVE